jgi:hypothetical protein
VSEGKRIRGFFGEQSFEITEGHALLQMFGEAQVYSATYREERAKEHTPETARSLAFLAVKSFRETQS